MSCLFFSGTVHLGLIMVDSGKVTAAINGSNDCSKLRLQSTIAEVRS